MSEKYGTLALDRVKKLCLERGISLAQLEKNLGYGASAIHKWKGSNPQIDSIRKVAEYFHVSTDYLLGMTDVEPNIEQLDPDIITLQRAKQNMSQEEWNRAQDIFRAGFAYAFKDQ